VVKALALGAHAVMIGRATLYGIAAGGEPGARRALAIFREETDRVMALLGCRSVADVGPECLHIVEGALRAAAQGRPSLKLLDTTRAAAEG